MDTVVQSDKLEMTEAEWQARCDLAALYRSRTISAGPTRSTPT